MDSPHLTALSDLPSVNSLLEDGRLEAIPHAVAVRAARAAVDQARVRLRSGEEVAADLVPRVLEFVHALRAPHLRRVINATGVVVHTNLGRAPLAPEVAARVAEVAGGYSNVEMALSSGRRGGRLDGVTDRLCRLSGAAAALAVNNNAAAVLLALQALADKGEVVISRGELVEIGGSFRVPAIISAGGAKMVEVGTTNRTRVSDYAAAITSNTRVLLRVHPSNFRQEGFTERASRQDLAALASKSGIPLVEDLGSGLMGDRLCVAGTGSDGGEDPVDEVIAAGVDVVCFSGDKLLGGPQAGLIVGGSQWVEMMRVHPLYRALRLDKVMLTALEATLRMIDEGRGSEVPTRSMLERTPEECGLAAKRLAKKMSALPGVEVSVEEDVGWTGGGALPGLALPSAVVAVRGCNPEALARVLRGGTPSVVGRVARDAFLVDPRTLLAGEDELVVDRLQSALAAVAVGG